jgi:hypothetical protein
MGLQKSGGGRPNSLGPYFKKMRGESTSFGSMDIFPERETGSYSGKGNAFLRRWKHSFERSSRTFSSHIKVFCARRTDPQTEEYSATEEARKDKKGECGNEEKGNFPAPVFDKK